MEVSAVVDNSPSGHRVVVRTGATSHALSIGAKAYGQGPAVNGGEFLMLALATCYCNDLYREAERLGIPIEGVQVQATAEFPGIGLSAQNIRYRAKVQSPASVSEISRLLRETDSVAEIHNTVRAGVQVQLVQE